MIDYNTPSQIIGNFVAAMNYSASGSDDYLSTFNYKLRFHFKNSSSRLSKDFQIFPNIRLNVSFIFLKNLWIIFIIAVNVAIIGFISTITNPTAIKGRLSHWPMLSVMAVSKSTWGSFTNSMRKRAVRISQK